MGCLGTDADPKYVPFLSEKLVEAIALGPGRHCSRRNRVRQSGRGGLHGVAAMDPPAGRIVDDPFGNPTVRANMHAGRKWDDVTGEAGPKDPDLSLISVQTREGEPFAVLANFSMHYFSDAAISADYFGLFARD